MRYRQIAVIGSGECDSYESEAYEIGRYIAKKKWALVSGGRGGIMEAASRGAAEENGIVIGIIPDSTPEKANKYCTVVIPTGMGHARNMPNVLSGDVVVAIGGSWGTLSEISFTQIFGKPLIVCEFAGGWSEKLGQLAKGGLNKNIHRAEKLEDVFRILDKLCS